MPNTDDDITGYIPEYLRECEYLRACAPNTLSAYRKIFRLWPQYGYGLYPESGPLVAMAMRQKGLRAVTVNSYLRLIRIFWNWLYKRGVLEKRPEVQLLPEPRKVKAIFDSGQVVAILRAKPSHGALKRVQALFAVAIDTGLRFGELASLRRQDIDAKSMLLTVCGKVGERRVPVSAEGMKWLNRHLQTHGHERVFCAKTGVLWEYRNARRELRELFELAGVPIELAQFHHIRRYALRQYVTLAGLRGAQLLAGHSKPETTLRYLDADAELRSLPHQSISPLARLSGYKR